MKSNQLRFLAPASDSICDDTIDVIIAYEDKAAGERAMQVFTRLMAEFGDDVHFQPHLWRFDILPFCRKFTESKPGRANLLIVSTSSNEGLPQAFREWLRTFLATRPRSGMVALFGGKNHVEDENSDRVKFLRDAAHKANIEFFEPNGSEPPARSLTFSHNQFLPTNHFTTVFLHPDRQNRGWGINE